MTTKELELEKHYLLAVTCNRRGERFKWVTALHVGKIVGHFTNGATVGLANDMSLSVDSLEKMAMAYHMYEMVRREDPQSEWFHSMLEIRNRLSIKHYWTMAQLWHRYEFELRDVVSYLVTAAENGASVETMRTSVVGDQETNYQTGWKQLLIKGVSSLVRLTEDYGVPEEIRALTTEYLHKVDDVMKAMKGEENGQ